MRGELRTTNSFGGGGEGASERAAAIRFVMKEVLHSLFRSPASASVRSFHRLQGTESICNERISRRSRHCQYKISIHKFWQRFTSSSDSFLVFDVTPPPSFACANFAACGRHAVSSFRYAHHGLLTRRITRLPPEHSSPSLSSSLRSIGGGSA